MTQEQTKPDSIHHVAIQVNDIERALEWYSSNFNTEVVYQDDTWAMLRFDNIYLALVIPGQHPPHIAIEHEGAESHGVVMGITTNAIIQPAIYMTIVVAVIMFFLGMQQVKAHLVAHKWYHGDRCEAIGNVFHLLLTV